ncbi:hypothetical protein ACSBOB_32095 [Mesorhizobium sp. ASY16-5R]|uniref:hypothetical protein n=1 Tax=Mesorhizobium sp. ASY16-5R TaxID=3445772 RepID=UPI003FA0F6D3
MSYPPDPATMVSTGDLKRLRLGQAAGERVRVAGTGMEEPPWVDVLGVEVGGVSGLVPAVAALRELRPFLSLADQR